MSTICLNMIVKNEATIIEETLANILEQVPLTYWVIADTGSSDDTPERIKRFFAERGINGELLHHEWKHFGHNRQLALDAAKGKADYLFLFDADDRICGDLGLNADTELNAGAYFLKMRGQRDNSRFYTRRLMIKNNLPWQWRGAVHEQLHLPKSVSQSITQSLVSGDYYIISGRFGARSQNPQKYYDDALMLERYFDENDEKELCAQNAFFCGQSYRDAKMYDKAAQWYQKSVDYSKKGSEQRRYALMMLAEQYKNLEQPEKAVYQWLLAYNNSPHNAEALVCLAEHFLSRQAYSIAWEYAEKSLSLSEPSLLQVIVVNEAVHRYGRHNAYLRAAIALGKYEQGYTAYKYLLKLPKIHTALNGYLLKVTLLDSIQALINQDEPSEQENIYQQIAMMTELKDNDKAIQQQILSRLAK
ncbi:glycosyltransferase [Conservatibacter flavescens]|uniref:Glycosyl transferase n=1 Tax=Conservatibacter flavescens TaxID=28161 RepID=A0A2M8S533_9PAST|nr:glycosyltransferase [Conservatibacter flavescens]PJG86252.1 glycosyl transferase [Conservatibacter flavescens]